MTDAPKPPKRRRRKIIVAFVVLVLVSMVLWWYYPRGDARFVGEWQVFQNGSLVCKVDLHANGLAIVLPSYSRTKSLGSWKCDGRRLVIGPMGSDTSPWFWRRLSSIIEKPLGIDFYYRAEHWDISSFELSRFTCGPVPLWGLTFPQSEWTRIHE